MPLLIYNSVVKKIIPIQRFETFWHWFDQLRIISIWTGFWTDVFFFYLKKCRLPIKTNNSSKERWDMLQHLKYVNTTFKKNIYFKLTQVFCVVFCVLFFVCWSFTNLAMAWSKFIYLSVWMSLRYLLPLFFFLTIMFFKMK